MVYIMITNANTLKFHSDSNALVYSIDAWSMERLQIPMYCDVIPITIRYYSSDVLPMEWLQAPTH